MSSPILMISCVESNNTYIYKFAITPNFISIIRNHPVYYYKMTDIAKLSPSPSLNPSWAEFSINFALPTTHPGQQWKIANQAQLTNTQHWGQPQLKPALSHEVMKSMKSMKLNMLSHQGIKSSSNRCHEIMKSSILQVIKVNKVNELEVMKT